MAHNVWRHHGPGREANTFAVPPPNAAPPPPAYRSAVHSRQPPGGIAAAATEANASGSHVAGGASATPHAVGSLVATVDAVLSRGLFPPHVGVDLARVTIDQAFRLAVGSFATHVNQSRLTLELEAIARFQTRYPVPEHTPTSLTGVGVPTGVGAGLGMPHGVGSPGVSPIQPATHASMGIMAPTTAAATQQPLQPLQPPHAAMVSLVESIPPFVPSRSVGRRGVEAPASPPTGVSPSTRAAVSTPPRQHTARSVRGSGGRHLSHVVYLFSEPLTTRHEGTERPMVALDIDTELGVLGRGLRATSRKLSLRVMCATTTNLSMAVVLGCTVLHFSGHGEDVDGLAFEDGHGAAHMLNAATLSKLLRPHHAASTPIKLVVVSSCHSQRVAQAFIDAGVEHVVAVGTDSLLNDVAAQYFARQFYMSLAASKTVRAAFDSALAMVVTAPQSVLGTRQDEHTSKFMLLPACSERGSSDIHERVVFTDLPAGAVHMVAPSRPPVSVPEHFIGRRVEMRTVVSNLLRGCRLFTIQGPPGIGKTAIAKAVLQYVCRRDMFLGGVHFVNLRSAQSAESVALKLAQALNMRGHSPNMDHLVRELNMRSLGHASTRGRTFAGASPPASRGRVGGSPHQVLIVLDNAEDLLHAADGALSNFVQPILDGCGSVQFLVTSKETIGRVLRDTSEKVLELGRLSRSDAAKLFLRRAPITITVNNVVACIKALDESPMPPLARGSPEFQAFQRRKLNEVRRMAAAVQAGRLHPDCLEAPAPVSLLQVLPIMEYLAGHPQAIAVKSGTLKFKSLAELEAPLLKPGGGDGGSDDDMDDVTPLQHSLDMMMNWMLQQEPAAVVLFALMSMFPGGALAPDLDAVWDSSMCYNPGCPASPAFAGVNGVAVQYTHAPTAPVSSPVAAAPSPALLVASVSSVSSGVFVPETGTPRHGHHHSVPAVPVAAPVVPLDARMHDRSLSLGGGFSMGPQAHAVPATGGILAAVSTAMQVPALSTPPTLPTLQVPAAGAGIGGSAVSGMTTTPSSASGQPSVSPPGPAVVSPLGVHSGSSRRSVSLPRCAHCQQTVCGPWKRLMALLINASIVQKLDLARPIECPAALVTGNDELDTEDVIVATEAYLTFPCIASYADRLLTPVLRRVLGARVCVHLSNLCLAVHIGLRGSRHMEARDLLARHEPNVWLVLRLPPPPMHTITSTTTAASGAAVDAATAAAVAPSTVTAKRPRPPIPRLLSAGRAHAGAGSARPHRGGSEGRVRAAASTPDKPRKMSADSDGDLTSPGDRGRSHVLLASQPVTAIGNMASLFPHCLMHVGRSADAVVACDLGLAACRALHDDHGEANVLHAKAQAQEQIGDHAALTTCQAAVLVYGRLGSDAVNAGMAAAKETLGRLKVRFSADDILSALRDLEEALHLYKHVPARQEALRGEAACLKTIAEVHKDYREAVREDWMPFANEAFRKALHKIRKLDTRDCVTEANILIAWGTFKLRCMHDVTACGEDLQAAYQLCQEGGYLQGEANTWMALGDMHAQSGSIKQARAHYQNALAAFRELKDVQTQDFVAFRLAQLRAAPRGDGESTSSGTSDSSGGRDSHGRSHGGLGHSSGKSLFVGTTTAEEEDDFLQWEEAVMGASMGLPAVGEVHDTGTDVGMAALSGTMVAPQSQPAAVDALTPPFPTSVVAQPTDAPCHRSAVTTAPRAQAQPAGLVQVCTSAGSDSVDLLTSVGR